MDLDRAPVDKVGEICKTLEHDAGALLEELNVLCDQILKDSELTDSESRNWNILTTKINGAVRRAGELYKSAKSEFETENQNVQSALVAYKEMFGQIDADTPKKFEKIQDFVQKLLESIPNLFEANGELALECANLGKTLPHLSFQSLGDYKHYYQKLLSNYVITKAHFIPELAEDTLQAKKYAKFLDKYCANMHDVVTLKSRLAILAKDTRNAEAAGGGEVEKASQETIRDQDQLLELQREIGKRIPEEILNTTVILKSKLATFKAMRAHPHYVGKKREVLEKTNIALGTLKDETLPDIKSAVDDMLKFQKPFQRPKKGKKPGIKKLLKREKGAVVTNVTELLAHFQRVILIQTELQTTFASLETDHEANAKQYEENLQERVDESVVIYDKFAENLALTRRSIGGMQAETTDIEAQFVAVRDAEQIAQEKETRAAEQKEKATELLKEAAKAKAKSLELEREAEEARSLASNNTTVGLAARRIFNAAKKLYDDSANTLRDAYSTYHDIGPNAKGEMTQDELFSASYEDEFKLITKKLTFEVPQGGFETTVEKWLQLTNACLEYAGQFTSNAEAVNGICFRLKTLVIVGAVPANAQITPRVRYTDHAMN